MYTYKSSDVIELNYRVNRILTNYVYEFKEFSVRNQ